MASGQITNNPSSWNLIGNYNIAPLDLSFPSGTSNDSPTNTTLTLESQVTIDGFLLKPLKMEQSF
jgi:hypothetical protein